MYAIRLQSERVRTCPMWEVDFNKYLEWLNDPAVIRFLTTIGNGTTPEEARQYIDRVNASDSDVLFAIIDKVGGKFIGTVHFYVNWARKEGGFGIMLGDTSFWGQGYGTEVFKLLTYYGLVILFLKRLIIGVDSKQTASLKYIHHCGYKRISGANGLQMYKMTQKQYLNLHPGYINYAHCTNGRLPE